MKTFYTLMTFFLMIALISCNAFLAGDIFYDDLRPKKSGIEMVKTLCEEKPNGQFCFDEFGRDFNFDNKRYNGVNFKYIGGGVQGKAYLSKDESFVVKIVPYPQTEEDAFNAAKEINLGLLIVEKQKSENLSIVTRCCIDNPSKVDNFKNWRIFSIMPFYKGKDLLDFMKADRRKEKQNRIIGNLDWKYNRMLEIANGLKDLHELGYAHGDLSENNVFVDDQGHCKVADFGFSKPLNNFKIDLENLAYTFASILLADIDKIDADIGQLAYTKNFMSTEFKENLSKEDIEAMSLNLDDPDPYFKYIDKLDHTPGSKIFFGLDGDFKSEVLDLLRADVDNADSKVHLKTTIIPNMIKAKIKNLFTPPQNQQNQQLQEDSEEENPNKHKIERYPSTDSDDDLYLPNLPADKTNQNSNELKLNKIKMI